MKKEHNSLHNLGILIATSFLGGMRFNMVRAVWQPFVLSLGASMPVLGFLEGLAGRRGLITAIIQPLSGWFSDRQGRKPFVAVANLMAIISLVFCIFADQIGTWWPLLPATIALGLIGISKPARDSMTAESVERKALGTAYSAVMMAFIVPGIFAPVIGGFIAEKWGFTPLFIIGIALECVALVLVLRFLQETLNNSSAVKVPSPNPSVHLAEFRTLWRDIFKRTMIPPSDLKGFYIATAVDAFVWGLGAGILYGMLHKTYGFSLAQLGLMSSVLSGVWAISQMPIGKLVDTLGAKVFLIASEVLGIAVVVGWITSTSFRAFLILQVGWALVAATWVPAMLTFLAHRVPSDERAEAMGKMAAFRGIFSFPAPYIGGLLYDLWGIRGPLEANLIGVIVALMLIIALVRE
ncbi:MAG: hypothetical protein DRI61_02270 [Chloroflexi bacterium]|nr:MAG: hypothetical protein DRI61_02270 [Chloroflexota bacterium]HDN79393.1 MFS transporter [Chloroflexota bacterium]